MIVVVRIGEVSVGLPALPIVQPFDSFQSHHLPNSICLSINFGIVTS